MKKLFSFFSLIAISASMNAQTIVSTTPENKNVVLEEFTGIHCGYCPDGHKIAQEIVTNNPGDAFMIAYHQGSYASPGTGEPDYRTSFGDAIANQTGLTGYPSGTVNRHVFSGGITASNRGSWAANTTTILAQSSYVNVGVEAQLDYTTRVLTVHCEVYYTANSTVTSNKLNIALLQNNVKGPQSGSSANPTMVTSDGKYLHQHMLRHFFTGQWGVTMNGTNSAASTLKLDTTFTYTLPASYTSIPVDLGNLEIVAFVAEGNGEIISADEFKIPAPQYDGSLSGISNINPVQCTSTINPSCTLTNKGTSTLTSADINYTIDALTPQTYQWTGSLAAGASATITIPTVTIATTGSHNFTVSITNVESIVDINAANNSETKNFVIFGTPAAAEVVEPFTSSTFPPVDWAIGDDNDGKNWIRATTGASGTTSSAKIPFYDIASGKTDDLYLKPMDMTTWPATSGLSFYVAHKQYSTSASDRIQVQVSTNCGSSWTTVWNKAGSQLATNTAVTTSGYTPATGDWRYENIDLSAYAGQASVYIRFHSTSAYGNNAYIDQINLGKFVTSLNEVEAKTVSMYPNPTTGILTISNVNNAKIRVMNTLGQVVITENGSSVDMSNLQNGTYFVQVIENDNVTTQKVILNK